MSGLEVAGAVLNGLQVVTAALEAYSILERQNDDPILRDIVLYSHIFRDCMVILKTFHDDEMTEAIDASVAEGARIGEQLSERQRKSNQSRFKFVPASEEKRERLHLEFKEIVTVLHSLVQSVQIRRILADQSTRGVRLNERMDEMQAERSNGGFDSRYNERHPVSHDDRYSTFSQRTFATSKAGSIADTVSMAEEIANRALRNGSYSRSDPSLDTGTVVVVHDERPNYIPVRAKYDTAADANFIAISFIRLHGLEDLLIKIEEGGTVENVFYGLDGHEYCLTHTITLHWCSATMLKVRHTLFHVAKEVPYDLVLGNDFVLENRVLNPQRVGLPIRSKRKTQEQRTEEARIQEEHDRIATEQALQIREEDRRKRALEKEARKLLKEQTSASAMIPAASPSDASISTPTTASSTIGTTLVTFASSSGTSTSTSMASNNTSGAPDPNLTGIGVPSQQNTK